MVLGVCPTAAQDGGVAIEYGAVEFGSISASVPSETWVFEGFAADLISIRMNRAVGELDPYLILLGPDGQVLATDDNSGEQSPDAAITGLRLPANGTYTILAQSSQDTHGDYELYLDRDDTGMIYGDMSSGGPIDFDIPMIGGISTQNRSDRWTFEGLSGDVITVEMKRLSGTLNPYVLLLTPAGEVFLFDDDNGGDGNALLEEQRLPASGTYTIITQMSPSGTTAGDYELKLTRQAEGVTPTPGGGALVYGEVFTGGIWDENPRESWTFDGTAGELITITADAASGNLDPVIELIGPDGTMLLSDDNSGATPPNARISDYRLRQSGVYSIIVRRTTNVSTVGDYELLVERTETGIVNEPGGGELEYGDVVEGALWDDNPREAWTFEGTAGELITITANATSGNLDTHISLVAPDGTNLISDDNSGEISPNALISDYRLKQSGVYSVVVRRSPNAYDATLGDYELLVERTESGITNEPGEGELSSGDQVKGAIWDDNPADEFTFEGVPGDLVEISMERESGNLDSFLYLLGPDGETIKTDDNSGENNIDAMITIRLTQAGTYTIVATRPGNSSSVGDYKLALERTERGITNSEGGGSLAYDTTVEAAIWSENKSDEWMFSASPGDVLTIVMNRESGNLDPMLYLIGPDGFVSREDNDGGGDRNALIQNYTIQQKGTYTIRATCASSSSCVGDYELLVERTERGITNNAGGGSLSYGTPAEAAIWNENKSDEWTFDAALGEVVSISMNRLSGSLDPMLRLFGPGGDMVKIDDNSGAEGDDALIANYLIQESGQYVIVATYARASTGDYELLVERTQRGIVERTGGGPLPVGERVVSAIMASNPADVWTFEGQEGDSVLVQMVHTSGNLDPFLMVLRPDGARLASDDNNAGNNDAMIGPVVLPAAGTYQVIAQASLSNVNSMGNYALSVTVTQAVDGSVPISGGGEMLVGETVSGAISNTDPTDTYRVQITEPLLVAIKLVRADGNLNGFVELYDADGVLVASDDDTAGGLNPLIADLELEPGEYTIVARRPDSDTITEGLYELTIERLD
ncbi:MAG: pre-peptidase C-terminal domain-containing protein [Anaerolineae bacterium]|nr:pre-peptidase C-terminal domain-containing protein [Anaerolineae bacterium]